MAGSFNNIGTTGRFGLNKSYLDRLGTNNYNFGTPDFSNMSIVPSTQNWQFGDGYTGNRNADFYKSTNNIIPGVNWSYGNPNRMYDNIIGEPSSGNVLKASTVVDVIPDEATGALKAAGDTASKSSKLGSWFSNNFGWSKGSGAKVFGMDIGKGANIGNAIGQGIGALSNLSSYQDAKDYTQDVKTDILASAANNPLLSSYLTSDQMALLNKLRRDSYDGGADSGDFFSGMTSGLGNAASSALMGGAVGGIPGALIGGVGSLINSGISGMTEAQNRGTTELEALYQALADAEAQYKSMKRPNFTGLGIQQQYQNMYK